MKRTRLVVDGVFFQRANTGIARLWATILPIMAKRMDILILDRGNTPTIAGTKVIPFASHIDKALAPSAAESIAIEGICKNWNADVFISTYYSTPLSTPSLQLVYDMIPEVLHLDLSHRDWQEKELALLYGRALVCISENTRVDLMNFYQEIDPDCISVAYCGIDRQYFYPQSDIEVRRFRKTFEISGPYLLMVGSRIGVSGYKNGKYLIDALSGMPFRKDLTLVCVGGEPEAPVAHMSGQQISVRRVELDDVNLACAYTGAEALVYPSLYEGFGMPTVEAMACGCPVITTSNGSLEEIVGEAALKVDGKDVTALRDALTRVTDPSIRNKLILNGKVRAEAYNWEDMANHITQKIMLLSEKSKMGRYRKFSQEWSRLRKIQADVDF